MVWHVFGDSSRPDQFHEATKTLLPPPLSPSAGPRDVPWPLDAEARIAALERTGAFGAIEYRTSAWQIVLDPAQTVTLYATFSNINIRPDRDAILAELHKIARDDFHGGVVRNMTTSLYTARRR
jgi:hypothetical protein